MNYPILSDNFNWQRNNNSPPGLLPRIIALLLIPLILITARFAASADETQIIAEVIAAEACGEDEIGLRAVACVIANRAKAQGVSPYAVVTARGQFYGYTAKNRHKLYLQVKTIVDKLAKNIMELPDITNGALYFRTEKEKLFPWCKIRIVKIGKHIFYK